MSHHYPFMFKSKKLPLCYDLSMIIRIMCVFKVQNAAVMLTLTV